jgi:hypothetical protein
MRLEEAQHYRALLFTRAGELLRTKSRDYSATADIFANLKACEIFGVMSAELGVWIRLADKVARLGSLLKGGAEPKATLDTVLDMINYAVYVYLLLIERDRRYARLLEGKKDAEQNP